MEKKTKAGVAEGEVGAEFRYLGKWWEVTKGRHERVVKVK